MTLRVRTTPATRLLMISLGRSIPRCPHRRPGTRSSVRWEPGVIDLLLYSPAVRASLRDPMGDGHPGWAAHVDRTRPRANRGHWSLV